MKYRTPVWSQKPGTVVETTFRHAAFHAGDSSRRVLLVLLALVLLLVLPAPPAGARGDGDTGGDGPWEAALTGLRVKAVLLDKLGTDALGVDVDVDDGQALLTGTVNDRSTQELAEQAALSVDGIRSVDNKLRLRRDAPQGAGETAERTARDLADELADARLEGKVHLRLFGEIGRHAGRLTVEAVDGVVSLRGPLPDRHRKKLALQVARDTKGVDKVIDLIEVED